MKLIKQRINESIEVKKIILSDEKIHNNILIASNEIKKSFQNGGKVMLCGNGGSASDAIHLAAEFVGRFEKERMGLPAIALNADISIITAVANDYGYEYVFSRSVEALGRENDILIGISTSGNSKNVYEAVKKAKELGIYTICLLGKDGGIIKDVTDVSIVIPSQCTARIQECHIMIGHIICELVEKFNNN